jgi:HTH-type transcriptional repressor of NAD biosynthesis genes
MSDSNATVNPRGHATGLIVGRFDPPHLGHSFMIDWAAHRCEQLVVFVNSSTSADTAPGELRARWLAELHPAVHVREVCHQLWNDWDDEELWGRWMALFRSEWPLATGPHVVFSSDAYVSEIARRFDAESVVVDADRVAVPISATQIRESPADHLHRLAPPVRSWVEANWVRRTGSSESARRALVTERDDGKPRNGRSEPL